MLAGKRPLPSSSGSELTSALQAGVDRLWVKCVNCSLSEREEVWDQGLVVLKALTGSDFECADMADALQDTGYRPGIFKVNARLARLHGSEMGNVRR